MIYDKRILNSGTIVRDVLEKIEKEKIFSFCVVDSQNIVLGVVSEGDIRRKLLSDDQNILSLEIGKIVKTDFMKMTPSLQLSKSEREKLYSRGIEFLPIISNDGHLIKIHELNNDDYILVSHKLIGNGQPCFIIAEIGNNHQGSIDAAIKLIDLAVEAGVDAVKFQMRNMDGIYGIDRSKQAFDLGVEYTLGLLDKFQLTEDELFHAMAYAKKRGLISFCTPWDVSSAKKLAEYGVDIFKVASADMTNFELIDYLCSTGIPLIISSGMSEEHEVKSLIARLNYFDVEYILLHCNSTYPAPYDQINLKYMRRLKDLGAKKIGYSGHEKGIHVPLAAVALGATVIEKHFTLDRNQEGVDHKVSLLPDEMRLLVEQIRDLEKALQGGLTRELSQGEMLNQQVLGKSLYVSKDISEGERIHRADIIIKSPGGGCKPYEINDVVGRKVTKNLVNGEILNHSCFEKNIIVKKRYNFKHIHGIPVRFHDYYELMRYIDCPMIEFHLSAKDMYTDPKAVFGEKKFDQELVVHTPELFDNDNLLDLASEIPEIRDRSIIDMQRTIGLCHKLKEHFSNDVVKLVVNVGGWNTSGFITNDMKAEKYRLLSDSLSQLDLTDIIFCIQTMAPFPWHFGGQSYHNLFVDPREIREFFDCNKHAGLALCLDVSHTLMASHYYGFDFYEDIGLYAQFIKHMHISDAEGSSGEGVEFGKGLLDISRLTASLYKNSVEASFIPEVWQGHKNNGSGFWNALKALEGQL